ncbi:MAG: cysteine desulfurase family protein [Halothiobacillus sp.]
MNTESVIYLDNNATTELAPEVLTAMMPYLSNQYANPSSASQMGAAVKAAIGDARAAVATLLGCRTAELIFTSGATEGNHAALLGVMSLNPDKRHLITSMVEHPSVLLLCRHLERLGMEVTYLPVDTEGQLNLDHLRAAIRPDTALISLMWANNETGVIFPIEEAAAIAKSAGVLFHTDATQALGKIPLDMSASGVDLLSCSAHKIHGPKGIGALYVRKGLSMVPLIFGHQERGRRGGTENVPAIIGFGAAAQLYQSLTTEIPHLKALRQSLETGILGLFPMARVHGATAPRLANTSNISIFPGDSEELLHHLEEHGITAATGAACAAGGTRPSHVLMAMGLEKSLVQSSLRFSVGRYNHQEDVTQLLNILPKIYQDMVSFSALAV